jgi:acyl-CoA thioester hydrolase
MKSVSEVRVRYAETDQMGVAYHANYLVWCEVGRTDFIRGMGVTYAELEAQGVMLAVADAHVRFHASAKYDDVVRIETTLGTVRSRLVEFEYELFRVPSPGATGGERLATASTSLVSLNRDGRPVSMPSAFRDLLGAAVSGGD